MLLALTRDVSPAFERCELTHFEREPIDVAQARIQHAGYEQALRRAGCRVERLPAEPDLPDSVFVEDAAVVFEEIAVITLPGARSRRGETESIAKALAPHRHLASIEPPGTLDGGDVLRVGKVVYVGRSSRSNREGSKQLRALLAPFGYRVVEVEFSGCLHLKSAATRVAEAAVLINPDWVDRRVFSGLEVLTVDSSEPAAANALEIETAVIFPASHPRTLARLRSADLDVRPVEVSELLKAEAGVTCCSLLIRLDSRSSPGD